MFDEIYDIHCMEGFVDQGGTPLWIFLHGGSWSVTLKTGGSNRKLRGSQHRKVRAVAGAVVWQLVPIFTEPPPPPPPRWWTKREPPTISGHRAP